MALIAHYAMRRGESRAGPKSVAQIAHYAKRRVRSIGQARTSVTLIVYYAVRSEKGGEGQAQKAWPR